MTWSFEYRMSFSGAFVSLVTSKAFHAICVFNLIDMPKVVAAEYVRGNNLPILIEVWQNKMKKEEMFRRDFHRMLSVEASQ